MLFALPSFFEVVSDDMLGDACHDLSFSRNPQGKFLGALDIYLGFSEASSGEMLGDAWRDPSFFLKLYRAKCLGALGITVLF